MLRGIERRLVFRDDTDRRDLLERLTRIFPETGTGCLAWSLMPNHVHLLLRTGRTPLSKVMARVNTGYALGFNRRHERVGYLFQSRYRSLLVERETYLLELVRYVHLNPLRAGLVESLSALERYPWTGHATLLGFDAAPFQDTQTVLGEFGGDPREARRRLLAWMHAGIEARPEAAERRLAPDEEWRVAPIPRDAESPHRSARPAPHARAKASAPVGPGADLASLIATVCAKRGVALNELLTNTKRWAVRDARAEIAYRACSELAVSVAEVARALRISKGAASKARTRGHDCAAGAAEIGPPRDGRQGSPGGGANGN
jgi:REP element-mobilizing transposase RayT